jgi:exonuclease III
MRYNCQGLGCHEKRKDVFNYLKSKKCDIYCLQDTHFTEDIHDRVKNEWGYDKCFFNSLVSNSRGTAIFFNNTIDFVLHKEEKDNSGNFIVLDVTLAEKRMTIINIYGPNKDSPDFFKNVVETAERVGNDCYIFCGDFNFVMNPKVDYKHYKENAVNNPSARNVILETMEDLDIVDIFRELHPEKYRYTWRRKNPIKLARLDFFLVSSSLLSSVQDCMVDPSYRSDHSMVILTIKIQDFKRGRGLWKFNNLLLYDKEYVEKIKTTILQTKKQYIIPVYNIENIGSIPDNEINFQINDQLFLEVLLMEIRGQSISYSTYLKKHKNNREKELKTVIKDLEDMEDTRNTEDSNSTLEELKKELEDIRIEKLKGALIRSKAKWIDESEKPTEYFCSLEKRNYTNKIIQRVEKEDGEIITNQDNILEETCKYYENLYQIKKTQGELREWESDKVFDNIRKLTIEEANSLEGELTYKETAEILRKMNNNTSPGSDGFTTEFFKFFWKDLGYFVTRSLNYAYEKGELSSTQKQGVIICLPKQSKPKQFLKNWRPITLLNTVYKIGSGCIANRIKQMLPKVINEDQTGFIPGRNITENTRLLYDVMNYTQVKNIPGMILLIDFEKAFDTVSWDYLFRVMKLFNFGTSIINWIKTFYKDITTTINQGGNLSRWFKNRRGCRQGDPISPQLFLLCAEILAIKLRGNKEVRGIKIGNTTHLISQFADDTSLFLDGTKKTLETTLNELKDFKEISGLSVNYTKSQVIWIGSKRNSLEKLVDDSDLVWNENIFKVLGIEFNINLEEIVNLNYNRKITSIKNLLKHWKRRNLTPMGRITVIKSLAISQIVHLFISLPNPSTDIVNQLNCLFYEFLWKSPVHKVKKSIVTQGYEKGGLNMVNLENFIASMKISWVKKLIQNSSKWQQVIGEDLDINHVIKYGPTYALNHIEKAKNKFWRDVFDAWKKLQTVLKMR